MANEINGFGPRNLGPNASVDSSRDRAEAKGDAQRSADSAQAAIREDDSVTLSKGATQLQGLSEGLADAAPFNQAKVDQIKTQISQGEYQIDSGKIAERLRAFESL